MCTSKELETETHLSEGSLITAAVVKDEKSSLDSSNQSSSQTLDAKDADSDLGSQSSNSGQNPNAGQNSSPYVDVAEFIRNNLSQAVSPKIKSDLPEAKDSGRTIDEINSQAVTSLIGILEKNEKERLEQQKPLRNCLLFFVGLQLLFFNGIIVYMMVHLGNAEGVNPSELLDFLKFYMGGALAELIAMIFFITRSTFASTGQDIVKGLMGRLSK